MFPRLLAVCLLLLSSLSFAGIADNVRGQLARNDFAGARPRFRAIAINRA